MIVFFVSECAKKARTRTVQVLDSFAERVGQSTWKTRLTMEGLKAVKLLLSRNASRHTAVACHRIVGHANTKLLWIIGNKRKFSRYGIVPTNYSRVNSIKQIDNDWHYLEAIKLCVALAGLFHDWGKAWDAFQDLLRENRHTDYLRHEFVSLLFWAAFVQGKEPKAWLSDLQRPLGPMEGELIDRAGACLEDDCFPFKALQDPLSLLIGWLILSHHLLPHPEDGSLSPCNSPERLLHSVNSEWGYLKKQVETHCGWSFSRGLPCRSPLWTRQAAKWAGRGKNLVQKEFSLVGEWDMALRQMAVLARTALMIGDHESSRKAENQGKDKKGNSHAAKGNGNPNTLWAKSLKKEDESSPVLLDSHLLDATNEALSFCHLYPHFEQGLACVESPEAIERQSKGGFAWQDRAADRIRKSVKESGIGQRGVFCLNMASTGTGKTFGNAKIMNAIQGGRLRYTLALGLRSLTLQTGDEYRDRIGLDSSELAVVVGSRAFRELHESRSKQESESEEPSWDIYSDWNEVIFSSNVLDEKLSTKLATPQARQVLYSPILVCTIDHVMGATEGVSRGRHILPWLRMLSADLVIDEVDDFDGSDLAAILRLVHLAGMLGRNVLLSSATIPPAVAEGAFNSYREGWRLFALARGRQNEILCSWIDETMGARVANIGNGSEFSKQHDKFTALRIKKIREQPVKRKGKIQPVSVVNFSGQVLESVLELHRLHAGLYRNKNVSFGVVRMANITPCVKMARFFLQADLPPDMEIKILPYHSRFPLISRHYIEKMLDAVLKRKDSKKAYEHPEVYKHIKNTSKKNVLFMVLATPVEEVGRDHDFDWAVLEPSSVRSMVQMAGRILRHRERQRLNAPNVIVLSHNIRALLNEKIAYTRPGYESGELSLDSHDLREILDERMVNERIDSGMRIGRISNPSPQKSLLHLEHVSLDSFLTHGESSDYKKVSGWLHGPYYLTDIAQRARPFRKGSREQSFFIFPEEPDLRPKFYKKDDSGKYISSNYDFQHVDLSWQEKKRLWLPATYYSQLEDIGRELGLTVNQAAARFGEISVPEYMLEAGQKALYFNPDLGLWQERNLERLFE
ncbi:type I-F CRISPR-associated helicase Cas3f [Desulfonatronum sp. SC1]|uniref:type I-F CRISPR-associated helicase Cas3f n=1 Tax=Desulfonatronum sp. SC1 TaxID=2109626 RepID=UPI000D30A435|nr:type I-F CRISPR-associated helicase Cas3f [Desulfonatronum sp. SC1]PTN35181.1 type I-F CRISPR-associated helicase Cas3 [Desulfonatronum sp. SC1]